jgi:hypothetical protein
MKKLTRLILIAAVILCCSSAVTQQHVHADAFLPGHGNSFVIQPKYELESVLKKCPGCGRTNTYRVKEQPIPPSCTERGLLFCRCEDDTGMDDDCGYENEEWVPALGHNYGSMTVQKAATCTASGTGKYTCRRCGHVKTETIKALGHNYQYVDVEATCTEEGHHTGTCTRCGDITDVVLPALGHDFTEYTVKTPASCEEDGLQEAICMRCSFVDQQVIPATGHAFPENWTIVKQPGYLISGLREKVCANCSMVIQEVLPAKIPKYISIPTGIGVIAAGGLILLKKLKAARKLFKPSVETKTIVVRSDNEDLVKIIKDRLYLSVSSADREKLLKIVEENEPDLLICQIDDQKQLDELLKEIRKQHKTKEQKKKEKEQPENKTEEAAEKEEEPVVLADTVIDLILKPELLQKCEKKLNKAVKDELISKYLSSENGNYDTFVKFVLPILKPDLKSDESLENFGQIADLLGIPGVSNLISVYTSGRDIKSTLEGGELGISETATVIGDIASILGLDTVGSIAGLVGDVESIKEAVDEESGAHEQKGGIDAIKDIVEVVSDVID